MSTQRQRDHSHFRRGVGIITCCNCKRRTRPSHRDGTRMCDACNDYCGRLNSHNDGCDPEHPDPQCPICNGTLRDPATQ